MNELFETMVADAGAFDEVNAKKRGASYPL